PMDPNIGSVGGRISSACVSKGFASEQSRIGEAFRTLKRSDLFRMPRCVKLQYHDLIACTHTISCALGITATGILDGIGYCHSLCVSLTDRPHQIQLMRPSNYPIPGCCF